MEQEKKNRIYGFCALCLVLQNYILKRTKKAKRNHLKVAFISKFDPERINSVTQNLCCFFPEGKLFNKSKSVNGPYNEGFLET